MTTTPFVNGKLLAAFVGKRVAIVGKALSQRQIITTDGQNVNIATVKGDLEGGNVYEIVGIVSNDGKNK